ncbi:MAG: hypothetical protein JSS61_02255 [Verrucomicrobia bacterium]|nr:hypothetical protein [Verrucomicrobiota bacterium]
MSIAMQSLVINEGVWKEHVDLEAYRLSFEGVVNPDEQSLNSVITPMAERVRDFAGVSVITMPQGISIQKLLKIGVENGISPYSVWSQVLSQIGDVELEQPYVGVISNSLLGGTREMTVLKRDAHLEARGYQSPPLTALLAVCIFHKLITSQYLFSEFHTLTSDKVDEMRVAIGGFDENGFVIDRADEPSEKEGAAALYRFLPAQTLQS